MPVFGQAGYTTQDLATRYGYTTGREINSYFTIFLHCQKQIVSKINVSRSYLGLRRECGNSFSDHTGEPKLNKWIKVGHEEQKVCSKAHYFHIFHLISSQGFYPPPPHWFSYYVLNYDYFYLRWYYSQFYYLFYNMWQCTITFFKCMVILSLRMMCT